MVVLRRHSGCKPFAQVPCTLGFDLHAAGFTCKVVAEAAPEPVFRLFDEAIFDGIAMDVAELFNELRVREDVEVVITGLPELFAVAFEAF